LGNLEATNPFSPLSLRTVERMEHLNGGARDSVANALNSA
jgi:hypothetical protein